MMKCSMRDECQRLPYLKANRNHSGPYADVSNYIDHREACKRCLLLHESDVIAAANKSTRVTRASILHRRCIDLD